MLALAGCGPSDDDPGPGGVTVGEARALDEAAAMLDAQRLPDEALRGLGDDSGERAAARQPDAAEPAAEPAPTR